MESKKGFTLIELMIVVVIIGILAAFAIPRFMSKSMAAKQTEAKEYLKAIQAGQKNYHNEFSVYTLNGVSANAINVNAFNKIRVHLDPGTRYTYTMTQADSNSFRCEARANLDTDTSEDVWAIRQGGRLVHLFDDATD